MLIKRMGKIRDSQLIGAVQIILAFLVLSQESFFVNPQETLLAVFISLTSLSSGLALLAVANEKQSSLNL